jgi:hypothetical protein
MIFLLWVRQTQSPLAAGLLLSPRYALGGVGFLQGFQILFEPWQQVCNRIGHCLQTRSLRLPQIVECLFAPVYRALRVADSVTELSQCQFSVIHRGSPQHHLPRGGYKCADGKAVSVYSA